MVPTTKERCAYNTIMVTYFIVHNMAVVLLGYSPTKKKGGGGGIILGQHHHNMCMWRCCCWWRKTFFRKKEEEEEVFFLVCRRRVRTVPVPYVPPTGRELLPPRHRTTVLRDNYLIILCYIFCQSLLLTISQACFILLHTLFAKVE